MGNCTMGSELAPGVVGAGPLPVAPVERHMSGGTTSIAVGRPAPGIDLQLATVDPKGRIPLRRAAATVGWAAGSSVALSLHDGVLRFMPAGPTGGVDLALDGRLRVQLPYGVRATTVFRPGVRLIVLAAPADRVVAAAPLAGLIDRFLGGL
jgi:hypothetical protein